MAAVVAAVAVWEEAVAATLVGVVVESAGEAAGAFKAPLHDRLLLPDPAWAAPRALVVGDRTSLRAAARVGRMWDLAAVAALQLEHFLAARIWAAAIVPHCNRATGDRGSATVPQSAVAWEAVPDLMVDPVSATNRESGIDRVWGMVRGLETARLVATDREATSDRDSRIGQTIRCLVSRIDFQMPAIAWRTEVRTFRTAIKTCKIACRTVVTGKMIVRIGETKIAKTGKTGPTTITTTGITAREVGGIMRGITIPA